jgi:hypothetical protein
MDNLTRFLKLFPEQDENINVENLRNENENEVTIIEDNARYYLAQEVLRMIKDKN